MIDENISPEDTEVQPEVEETTDTNDNSGQDVKDEIPTPQVPEDLAPEAVEAYNAAIESAKKEMQAGLTKKFQSIADEKKDIADLRDKAKLYDEIKAQEEAEAKTLSEDATDEEKVHFYLNQKLEEMREEDRKKLAPIIKKFEDERQTAQLDKAKSVAKEYGLDFKDFESEVGKLNDLYGNKMDIKDLFLLAAQDSIKEALKSKTKKEVVGDLKKKAVATPAEGKDATVVPSKRSLREVIENAYDNN